MSSVGVLSFASVLLLIPAASPAEPYAVGDQIEPFTLEDQHGAARAVDAAVELILFSRDMEGGDVLKEALAAVAKGELADRKAVYVSDISQMPGLVARLFAIPAMRDRPYSMALDRDGETTARLPATEAKATLIFLERLRVERVLHLSTAAEVREVLGLASPSE